MTILQIICNKKITTQNVLNFFNKPILNYSADVCTIAEHKEKKYYKTNIFFSIIDHKRKIFIDVSGAKRAILQIYNGVLEYGYKYIPFLKNKKNIPIIRFLSQKTYQYNNFLQVIQNLIVNDNHISFTSNIDGAYARFFIYFNFNQISKIEVIIPNFQIIINNIVII